MSLSVRAAWMAPMLAALGACSSGSDDTAPTHAAAGGAETGGTSSAGAGGAAGGAGGAGGGAAGAIGGAGAMDGGTFTPAEHVPLPQLMPHGNVVVKHPQIVTVTYADFDKTMKVQDFGDALASSPWLAEVGADYGVGAATHLKKVVLPENAPAAMTDADVFTMLETNADGLLPAYTPDTIFLVYLPSTTAVDASAKSLGQSCSNFLGYHDSDKPGDVTLLYVVVVDCENSLDRDTSTASHELIEAATDGTDGWWYEGADDDPLGYIDDGTEAADMCEWYPNVEIGGFAYQRVWSNSAAAASMSPCIPAPAGEPYRNVSPDKPLMPVLEPGQSTTITLTGWSTLPVPNWPLDFKRESTDGGFTPTVAFSSNTINNGTTVTVTLTVPMDAPAKSYGVVNIISDPEREEFWALGVLTP